MILKGKVALITASIQRIQFYQWNNDCGRWGMTGYHPVGFLDLIPERMKKKS